MALFHDLMAIEIEKARPGGFVWWKTDTGDGLVHRLDRAWLGGSEPVVAICGNRASELREPASRNERAKAFHCPGCAGLRVIRVTSIEAARHVTDIEELIAAAG